MKKTDGKKAKYSALSNYVWSVRMLLRHSRLVLLLTLLLIPVGLGVRYLEIYLPSLAVSLVSEGGDVGQAALAVGTVMLLLLAGYLLTQTLTNVRQGAFGIYRLKMSDRLTRKKLAMFYQTYEKKEVRDLADRALMATAMWGGVQPLTDMVYYSFGMIENVLGYVLFGSIISFASPWLVPLLTVAPIVNLLAVRAYNKWEYANREKVTVLNQKLGHVEELPDNFAAAKDIRIYGMSAWLRECYRDLSALRAEWDKTVARKSFLSRIADLIVILIRDGGAYVLLVWMFYHGEITVAEFVLYFAAISSFAAWVDGIIHNWNMMHSVSLKLCDYREYMDYPDENETGTASADAYLSDAPEIEFKNVCFRYDGAEKDTVCNFSLTIKKGEKLALVGLNGAGKTTLVKLLCGLYTPTSGEILYNGVLLSDFKRKEYYKLISPVFQDVQTAFFSLAQTVSGKRAEETDAQRAEKCMRMSGLGEKLDTLPMGIDTKLNKQINRDGTELSGGEAQKLMLARALYKDAPLLILDEPTAALDPIAESRIYKQFHEMARHKTALFISHRLASTSFCDRILLLENGKIKELGTHRELMQACGTYKDLFDMQSCWYKDGEGADKA